MDFSAHFRTEVRVTPADVGKRISVRCLRVGAPKGEKFTDTVGVLTSWDDGVLLITRRSGDSVRVPESSLVAGKVVPSAPARRRGPAASYGELARVAARAWRPVEREHLGEWELRAAAGFTRRANSVLPLGEPGVPLDEALARVREWYGVRGLPAYAQTATGAAGTQEQLCAELEARGWVREVSAELWVGALAPVADLADPEPGRERTVTLSREADESWLGRYRRKGVSEVAFQVLGSGPSVWFATVPGTEPGVPAAIGRCVVDGRWAGFAAVEVDPALRRRGLATTVMTALARRALAEGASAGWLQVETDNAGALALYTRLGFTAHHRYHHYRAPTADSHRSGAGNGADDRGEPAPGRSGGPGGGSSGGGGTARPVRSEDVTATPGPRSSRAESRGGTMDRYRSA